MGCCDSLPDIPNVIQPDPDMVDCCTVSVSKMGWSRDYAIYQGSTLPPNKEEKTQKMWLWFNKSDSGPKVKIELENFNRGQKEDKNIGECLWGAEFTDKLKFDYKQKVKGQPWQQAALRFAGFSTDHYDSDDDDFYSNHSRNRECCRGDFEGTIVSKWQMNTSAVLYGGDTPRTKTMEGEKMILKVYSKGTVITNYYLQENVDSEGHVSHQTNKKEVEFIDRIEYRLEFRGNVVYTWVEPGDSGHDDTSATGDWTVSNPLYDITYKGGFFKSSYSIISTKAGVDPALAMLVGHLVATEYSNAAIKSDLQVRTPDNFPRQHNFFSSW